ncbi:12895_t:CDS:1, partial [Funneliformis geosporum]
MSSFTSTHANPSVEPVEGWSLMDVKNFLNSSKDKFSLNDDEIEIIEKNGTNSVAFIEYTVETLMQD